MIIVIQYAFQYKHFNCTKKSYPERNEVTAFLIRFTGLLSDAKYCTKLILILLNSCLNRLFLV